MQRSDTPLKSNSGKRRAIDSGYRERLRPANDWEDEIVKRLVLNRWAKEQHRQTGDGRLLETFLKRSSAALNTLAELRKRRVPPPAETK